MILTEVHLLESRVYRGVGNFAKSKVRLPILPDALLQLIAFMKAALTSARTAANSIYCAGMTGRVLDTYDAAAGPGIPKEMPYTNFLDGCERRTEFSGGVCLTHRDIVH